MKGKIDFQDGCHGGHLGLSIGTILTIFDLQNALILATKFQVNWHLGTKEEAQPYNFPIGTIFAIFYLQVTPILLTESTGLLVQKKKRKIDFQDSNHLGFLIRMILAIFNLQAILMPPIKFRVSWPRGVVVF